MKKNGTRVVERDEKENVTEPNELKEIEKRHRNMKRNRKNSWPTGSWLSFRS
jgi:hypothetical protein